MEKEQKQTTVKTVKPAAKETAGNKTALTIGNAVSPETLIAQAIDKNVPIETMEKLLGMRRELKAEWAKEKFDAAMAQFQGECPVIAKKKAGGKTKVGAVAYKYAPLDEIVRQVKELIQKHGFSYLIKAEMPEGKVKITCIVKHSAGHTESTDVEMPLTTKTEIMSVPQQVAATITFAKRYAFCNAFGILTGDDDTDAGDGAGAGNGKKSYENAITAIAQADNAELLAGFLPRIENQKSFTVEQREQLVRMVKEKIAKLTGGHEAV